MPLAGRVLSPDSTTGIMNVLLHSLEVLGLSQGASEEEARQAYRELVKVWHPDRFSGLIAKKEAQEKLVEINNAYGYLKSYYVASKEHDLERASELQKDEPPPRAQKASAHRKKHLKISKGLVFLIAVLLSLALAIEFFERFHNTNASIAREEISGAEGWYEKGNALKNAGSYGDAISAYNRAIDLKPDHSNAYYNRGTSYSNLGRYPEAIKDFSTAVALNPNDPGPYVMRGLTYRMTGEIDLCLSDMTLAARMGDKTAQNFLATRSVAW
jgi:tetratricopeptide (TPR) repeat protein